MCISCVHYDQWETSEGEERNCNLYNERNPKRCDKYRVKEGFVDLNKKPVKKEIWRCL